jgi:hypothetical protein
MRDLVKSIEKSRDDGEAVSIAALTATVSNMTKHERESLFQAQVLELIGFQHQYDREHRIVKAHFKTFHWVFTNQHREGYPGKSWSDFVSWLETDQDPLYWITGKAGSGKSTLMKFIVHSETCSTHLGVWSGECPLVITRFYFWNSGAEDQQSQEGLLRSILHDALTQRPEEIPRVLPQRWSRMLLWGNDFRALSHAELVEAFNRLVSRAATGAFKLCLFVDGLDEFNGDHQALIDLLKEAIAHPNIKACVSSRPWVVFEEAFIHQPSLMLEHMTYPDILAYISTHFNDNFGFATLKEREPHLASSLIEDVAQKSRGVFLWVTLVVRSLLGGLSNFDHISDLQRRLDDLPSDLELFYEKMLGSIDPFYASHAGRLFILAATTNGRLTALGLSFADGEECATVNRVLDFKIGPLSETEQRYRFERTRRQLSSRCKGLLEIPFGVYGEQINEVGRGEDPLPSTSYQGEIPFSLRRVAYLHRTVRDFLESPQIKARIIGMAGVFCPFTSLIRSNVLMIKSWDASTSRWHQIDQHVIHGLRYACEADKAATLEGELLDEMRRCVRIIDADCLSTIHLDPDGRLVIVCAPKTTQTEHDGFLALAAAQPLFSYIPPKVLSNISIFADQRNEPLLHRIIRDHRVYLSFCDPDLFSARSRKVPSPTLVQHEPNGGADPNYVRDGETTWALLLRLCVAAGKLKQSTLGKPKGHDDVDVAEMHCWVTLVELFIKAGADPRMDRNSQLGSCIHEAFFVCLRDRSKQLGKLLASQQKRWSLARRFVTPPLRRGPETEEQAVSIAIFNRRERARQPSASLSSWFPSKARTIQNDDQSDGEKAPVPATAGCRSGARGPNSHFKGPPPVQ